MITIIRIVHVVIISAEKVLYRNSIGLSEQKVIVSACSHTLQTKTHLSVRLQIILFWNSLIKRTMRPSAKSAVMVVGVVVMMWLIRFGCFSVFNYLYIIIIKIQMSRKIYKISNVSYVYIIFVYFYTTCILVLSWKL